MVPLLLSPTPFKLLMSKEGREAGLGGSYTILHLLRILMYHFQVAS